MELNMSAIEEKIREYAERLNAPVCMEEFLPDAFIQKHSLIKTAREWFAKAGVTDQESFDRWLESDTRDRFCYDNTDFDDWDAMFRTAAIELLPVRQKRLRDGEPVSAVPVNDDPFSRIQVELRYTVA